MLQTQISEVGQVVVPVPAPEQAPSSGSGPLGSAPAAPTRGVSLATAIGWLMAMAGYLIGSRLISDNSFFTHFANGRLFWEGKGIPRVDPYSFTAPGEAVTVQSWLASVIYAGLHEFVGEWSLRVFNGALCLLLVLALWKLTEPARQLLPRVALVGPAIVLGTLLWSPRPLLFGLLGLAALLLVLEGHLPLWSLLPIMWVWVNTHGSFPLALVVVGGALVGQLLDDASEGHSAWRRLLASHEVRVLGATIGGVALGAVNPLGPRLLWFPIHLLGRQEALRNVIEWSAPTFKSPAEWGFVALFGLLVAAAKFGARWRSLLPGFLFVVAGLLAIRNVAPASIVLVWAAAPALCRFRRLSLNGDATGILAKAVLLLSALVVALATSVALREGPLDLRSYPREEVSWLEERSLVADPDVRLLTRETDGNYLELRFGDEANVFVDDRFDFYPQGVLDDLDTLVFGGDFAPVLERHEIDVVLWEDRGTFAAWLQDNDDWFVAHRTEQADESQPHWFVACRLASTVADTCRR